MRATKARRGIKAAMPGIKAAAVEIMSDLGEASVADPQVVVKITRKTWVHTGLAMPGDVVTVDPHTASRLFQKGLATDEIQD